MRLGRLQRQKRRIDAYYDKKLRAAEKAKAKRDEIGSIESEARFESRQAEDDINRLTSRFLVSQAERYILPVPQWKSDSPSWQQDSMEHFWHLTPAAMADLRDRVRKEEKERFESWSRWVPILSGLTGLFGSAIGLIALAMNWAAF